MNEIVAVSPVVLSKSLFSQHCITSHLYRNRAIFCTGHGGSGNEGCGKWLDLDEKVSQ